MTMNEVARALIDADLPAAIDGLILQATTERSHYYTADVLHRVKAALSTSESAREAAERELTEARQEARSFTREHDAAIHRAETAERERDLLEKRLGELEAVAASLLGERTALQAQVEAGRKVVEPFTFALSGWEHEMNPSADTIVVAGWMERIITYGHMRALLAWVDATPTDLLNDEREKVWDEGWYASDDYNNPYRRPTPVEGADPTLSDPVVLMKGGVDPR